MPQLSLEQARDVIAKIRSDNGGIAASHRKFLQEELPEVLEALTAVRRKLANATKILVNNLYSKDSRFLYELIQNAEDNKYSMAADEGEKPFLTFKIYPDKIIVDSNEDGFSEENVRAVCSVGDSTKANSEGYIGEKGIGFKSVFKIAKKVHIQSGPFSFAFEYTRGQEDDGLGMVTPDNEEAEKPPTGVRTRMILTLRDGTDFEQLTCEFRSIPETLLLFLRRLHTLTIEVSYPDQSHFSARYSKFEAQEGGLNTVSLTKSTRTGAEESAVSKKFHCIKTDARDLPYDEARLDKMKNAIDRAEVILAFPIDDTGMPILEQQHTFAFLPLRSVGFKFLIQSDFVTQANREDVVSSPRNKAILAGVAGAFRDAMLLFCKHPSLRYQWMRYLPGDSISDEFWKTLPPLIREVLRKTPLLEPWSGIGFSKPSNLRGISTVCDKSGNPLLPDLKNELYLSWRYADEDYQLLRPLGVNEINWSEFIDRLDADLKNVGFGNSGSRWKSLTYDMDWRIRMCSWLRKAFESDNLRPAQKRLKELDLIPLHYGTWRSNAAGETIRFPDTDGIPIPTDIGLKLVHPDAVKNAAWVHLLTKLGVTDCTPEHVVDSISKRYRKTAGITLDNCVSHVRYLYYHLPQDFSSLKSRGIKLVSKAMQLHDMSLYFPDTQDEYSPAELFKMNEALPGCQVHFLHPEYLKAVDSAVIRNGRSWLTWLEEVAGVLRTPHLSRSPKELSLEFRYIIEHRSERLLGTLKRYWPHYERQIAGVTPELRSSKVKLEAGGKLSLEEVFLPFPKLKQIAADVQVQGTVPFIVMSEPLRDEERMQWAFLEKLHVGIEDDIYFYSSALQGFRGLNPSLNASLVDDSLSRLYLKLQSKCHEDLEFVCDLFRKNDLIYVPSTTNLDASWVQSGECIWDGPTWLRSKQRLNIEAYQGLQWFFKASLRVPDACQADILSDLSEIKKDCEETSCTSEVERIYDCLWHGHSNSKTDESRANLKVMRDAFEKSSLVYTSRENAWFPPSLCVWAEHRVKIPGKASIASLYHQKKKFFTQALGVLEPTVRMYIESLRAEAKGNTSTSRLKEIMELISSLGVEAADVVGLRDAKVFPIKLANGEKSLASASASSGSLEFAIVDKHAHWDNFRGKIAALDFSLEDIRDTRPFLVANGLEHRLSSRLVEEVTDVKGGVLDNEMTTNMRLKTTAIVRCAIHYAHKDKRKDAEMLYRTFRHASVYMSDSIGRSMRMVQNGRLIEGYRSQANFHLEENDGILRLYLPKDETDRDVCFERQLPRRLCEFLGIADVTAESVIGGIIRKDKQAVIDRILSDAGVGKVDGDFTALNEDYTVDGPEMKALVAPSRETEPSISSAERTTLEASSMEIENWSTSLVGRRNLVSSTHADALSPRTVPFRQSSSTQEWNTTKETAYAKILDNVVNIARKRTESGIFETGGPRNDRTSVVDALPVDIVRDAFGSRSYDRNFKLGAAGELYMFEYLNGLKLPRFGLGNWKSSIRAHVGVHPEYTGIENVDDRSALADIEYKDCEGKLTEFLIRRGHLERETWTGERPFYHLEVKTTTIANWQEPFYLSKAQEAHIQSKGIKEGKTATSVYIVCRLFNLGKGDETGLNIYLDPETNRRKRQLEFTPFTWAVKPLWYSGMANWLPPRDSDTNKTPTLARRAIESHEKVYEHDKAVNTAAPISVIPHNDPPKSSSAPFSSLPVLPIKLSNGASKYTLNNRSLVVRLPPPSAQSGSVTGGTESTRDSLSNSNFPPLGHKTPLFKFGTLAESSSSLFSTAFSSNPGTGLFGITEPGKTSSEKAGTASGKKVSADSGFGLQSGANEPPKSNQNSMGVGGLFASTSSTTPISKVPGNNTGTRSLSSGGVIFDPLATGSFGVTTPVSSRPNAFGALETRSTGSTSFGAANPASSENNPFGSVKFGSTGSLFGVWKPQPAEGLFGLSSFGSQGSPFGASKPELTWGVFGSAKPEASGNSSFGAAPSRSSGSSLFGAAKLDSTGSPFGSAGFGSTRSLFGTSNPEPTGGLFGSAKSESVESSFFGAAKVGSTGGLFGGAKPQSPGTGSLGSTRPEPSGSNLFGSSKLESSESKSFGSAGSGSTSGLFGSAKLGSSGNSLFQTATPRSPGGQPATIRDNVTNTSTIDADVPGTISAGIPPFYSEKRYDTEDLEQHQSLTTAEEFREYSFEELHLADYKLSSKGPKFQ